MTQLLALSLFLALSVVCAAAFIAVARSTAAPEDVPYEATAKLRARLFWVVLAVLLVFLGLTIPYTPYPDESAQPDRVVHVRARQFAFDFSDRPFPDDATTDPDQAPLTGIATGDLVEFRVTAMDVTHGFGVYDADGALLAQVQAMPGYVNRLRMQFDTAATYEILCMEYCGAAHHVMRAALDVEKAN
ncbi:MAG: hypothetical protein AAF628_01390 [Planctomycetota bacterium]